jgi:hypothetical protein
MRQVASCFIKKKDRDVRERTVIKSVETSSAIEGIRTIFKRRAKASGRHPRMLR